MANGLNKIRTGNSSAGATGVIYSTAYVCATRIQRREHAHSATSRIPRVEQPVHHDPVALIRPNGRCRLSTGGTLCNGRRSQWPGKFAEDEMALPGLPRSYFSLPFSSHLSLFDAFARAVEIESRARSRKRPSGSLQFCGWIFLRGCSRGQCWNTVVRILNCTRWITRF